MITPLIHLHTLACGLQHTARATQTLQGASESVAAHTVGLGLAVVQLHAECSQAGMNLEQLAFAQHPPSFPPPLKDLLPLVLVHDLVEVYCGDTNTLGITPQQAAEKAAREAVALERLRGELPPMLRAYLDEYEGRRTPAAQFVSYVDKIMPKLAHCTTGAIVPRQMGYTAEKLEAAHEEQRLTLRMRCPAVWQMLEPYFVAACAAAVEALRNAKGPVLVAPVSVPASPDFCCAFWGPLPPGRDAHMDCSVVLRDPSQVARCEGSAAASIDPPFPRVCPCECQTCRRAWWTDGRPVLRDGVLVRKAP